MTTGISGYHHATLTLPACMTDRIAPILQMKKARPRKLSNLPKVTLVSAEPGFPAPEFVLLYFHVGFFRGSLPLTPLNALDPFR